MVIGQQVGDGEADVGLVGGHVGDGQTDFWLVCDRDGLAGMGLIVQQTGDGQADVGLVGAQADVVLGRGQN